MNREIKFRGIHTYSGNSEMVYGYYFKHPNKDTHSIFLSNGSGSRVVDKNSVSQFTGLKDENGVEIYEGDIIRFPELYETPEMTNTHYIEAVVVFAHAAFQMQVNNEELGPDTYTLAHEMEAYDGHISVIGNIYQNPELLK